MNLSPLPIQKFFDNNGRPLVGGLLFTYEAGTTAKIATYSDEAGAPNTNPVVLDYRGEARVWLDPAVTYKFTLSPAGDTDPPTKPIWTVDNIQAGATFPEINPITPAEIAAGVTVVNFLIPSNAQIGYIIPERYGNNAAPGTTVMDAALAAAVAVGVESGGGTVLLIDRYKTTTTWEMGQGVNVLGLGYDTSVEADNCDAIKFSFFAYHSKPTLDNFAVLGLNGDGTRVGIYQPGTTDVNDQLYGITIQRLLIRNFSVGILFSTAWENVISDNRIEDVDRAIRLIGANIGSFVSNNHLIRTAGGGSIVTSIGIQLDGFTYATGGLVPPEGVLISKNLIYGFATGINIPLANYVNILDNDFFCTVYGVSFTSVSLNFNINDNYFQFGGPDVVAGIAGAALAVPLPIAKVSIRGNSLNGLGDVGIGIQLNDVANGGQNFVTIEDNFFAGFGSADIHVFNPGQTWIRGNHCASSVPTNSVVLGSVLSGQVFVDENNLAKALSYAAADESAGLVVVGPNTVSGTSIINSGAWVTPTFNAGDFTGNGAMTWTVGAGDVGTFAYLINGKTMTVAFTLSLTAVGGVPDTALFIAIPAGRTAAKLMFTAAGMILDNLVAVTGSVGVSAGGTSIVIQKVGGAAWTPSADQTYVRGQITFEIQ